MVTGGKRRKYAKFTRIVECPSARTVAWSLGEEKKEDFKVGEKLFQRHVWHDTVSKLLFPLIITYYMTVSQKSKFEIYWLSPEASSTECSPRDQKNSNVITSVQEPKQAESLKLSYPQSKSISDVAVHLDALSLSLTQLATDISDSKCVKITDIDPYEVKTQYENKSRCTPAKESFLKSNLLTSRQIQPICSLSDVSEDSTVLLQQEIATNKTDYLIPTKQYDTAFQTPDCSTSVEPENTSHYPELPEHPFSLSPSLLGSSVQKSRNISSKVTYDKKSIKNQQSQEPALFQKKTSHDSSHSRTDSVSSIDTTDLLYTPFLSKNVIKHRSQFNSVIHKNDSRKTFNHHYSQQKKINESPYNPASCAFAARKRLIYRTGTRLDHFTCGAPLPSLPGHAFQHPDFPFILPQLDTSSYINCLDPVEWIMCQRSTVLPALQTLHLQQNSK